MGNRFIISHKFIFLQANGVENSLSRISENQDCRKESKFHSIFIRNDERENKREKGGGMKEGGNKQNRLDDLRNSTVFSNEKWLISARNEDDHLKFFS